MQWVFDEFESDGSIALPHAPVLPLPVQGSFPLIDHRDRFCPSAGVRQPPADRTWSSWMARHLGMWTARPVALKLEDYEVNAQCVPVVLQTFATIIRNIEEPMDPTLAGVFRLSLGADRVHALMEQVQSGVLWASDGSHDEKILASLAIKMWLRERQAEGEPMVTARDLTLRSITHCRVSALQALDRSTMIRCNILVFLADLIVWIRRMGPPGSTMSLKSFADILAPTVAPVSSVSPATADDISTVRRTAATLESFFMSFP